MTIDWNPSPKKLREFGYTGSSVLFLLLGMTVWKRPEMLYAPGLSLATVAIGLTGFLLIASSLFPRVLKPLFLVMSVVAFPIGYLVNLVLLGILFYGVFTPMALFFRAIGRDSLCRKLKPNLPTYWQPREQQREPEDYFRPF